MFLEQWLFIFYFRGIKIIQQKMKGKLLVFLSFLFIIYILVCILLYFIQESLLFHPTKLHKDYQFSFNQPFEEKTFTTPDNIAMNAIYFQAENSKGIVYELHGNGGDLQRYGDHAHFFTKNGYDILYLDYRSYGKSEGTIRSEQQLVDDAQLVYNEIKKQYPENKIILSGTSMGSGIASRLAIQNNPQQLILNTPYYSLESLIRLKTKILPNFILRYRFRNDLHLEKVDYPITVFHGTKDFVIPYKNAKRLKETHSKINFYTMENIGHNNFRNHPIYLEEMTKILK